VNGRDGIFSLSKRPVWYTDGSKTSSGTGRDVFEGKTGLVFSLGAFAAVFQAEVFAIMAALCKITIFTDSQAALKALESVTVKSKLLLECLECLSELATRNSVQLVWVPGHEGILGNERADELAKKGADTRFTGPEPVLGLPYSMVIRAIGDRMERKHTECWNSGKDCKHSKTLMEGPQQSRSTKLLNMNYWSAHRTSWPKWSFI
jgi:Ribonuclease HI